MPAKVLTLLSHFVTFLSSSMGCIKILEVYVYEVYKRNIRGIFNLILVKCFHNKFNMEVTRIVILQVIFNVLALC